MINQQKRNKTFTRKAKIETLEPRIMMSADLPGLEFLQNNHETEDHLQQSKIILKEAEQNIAQSITEAVAEDSQQLSDRQELIVIDKSIDDYQSLVNNIQTSESETVAFEIALIETNENGIEAIDHYLSANATTSYDAIHILSHGDVGQFQLGNLNINNQQLSGYQDSLESWSTNLTENADILLYACNLTVDEQGEQLIQQIASLTNADVAASDDITGHTSLNGDWLLETQTGNIDSQHEELLAIFQQWQGTLDTPGVNDAPVFSDGDGVVIDAARNGANSVAVQSDGKLLVLESGSSFALTRYNADGSLDNSFGSAGTLAFNRGSSTENYWDVTVQSDDKIIISGDYNNSFSIYRYNADGSPDTSFSGDGHVDIDISSSGSERGYAVAVQPDDKVVVGGLGAGGDFALVRINANGSYDTSFSGNAKLQTDLGATDVAYSLVVQPDGKLLLAGTSNGDFAMVRYNTDGSVDTGFGGGDGIAITDMGAGDDKAFAVELQADGKIVLAGSSNGDIALARYETNGSLDNSFGGGDGIVLTDIATSTDSARGLSIQADGKIVAAGSSNGDFALLRYNTDGSLDTSFSGGGVTTDLGGVDNAVKLLTQDDGKFVLAGGSGSDLALVRYNSDGTLDSSFDSITTLDGNQFFTEGGPAVVLEPNVDVSDAELDALNGGAGNYSGSSLTLVRNGGANAEDVFSFNEGNGITLVGNDLIKNGQIIASFDTTSTLGELVIAFTDANVEIPTSAGVDSVLRQITYNNSSDTPPASVQINWTFDDGNAGDQGSGGALQALGNTTINNMPTNDAPTFSEPGGFVKTSIGTYYDYGEAVVIQLDGKIIVATDGTFGGNSGYQFMVSRYNTDGSLDTSFGDVGTAAINIGSGSERIANVALQADGKILLTGYISGFDIALVRLDTDGSLDTSFGGGDGIAITNVSVSDQPLAIAVQSDNKIIVGGTSFFSDRSNDFSLVRFNSNGTLDSSFGGGDGKVTTDFYGSYDAIKDVFVLPDGKIIVGGVANSPTPEFAAARYNPDGSLDTSFGGGDGLVSTSLGSGNDFGEAMALQQDGKVLVTGLVRVDGSYDVGVVRYNADGTLDSSFGGGDGKVVIGAGEPYDAARAITVQADGKILVTGSISADGATDHSLWRFNVDGSLDTSFGNGLGYVTASIANGNSEGANDVVVQADGKIVITGYAEVGSANYAVSLLRFNADGSPDNEFGITISTLDNNPTFVENGTAVILDSDVKIFDAELSTIDNFSGATLIIERNSAANNDDVFSSTGTLGDISATSGNLLADGINIGTYDNAAGTLTFSFNASATNALVNSAMQQIAYSNLNDNPPASVQLDWLFNDNNLADQGSGGALFVQETMTVNITSVNDAPVITGIESVALAYTENDGAVAITSTTAFTDGDDTNLESAVVQITGNYDNGEDLLAFNDSDNISGIWDTANGTLTLTGSDTVANYEAAIRSITYENTSDVPSTLSRTVSFFVNDGDESSSTVNRDIAITMVNDVPTFNFTLNGNINYANSGAVVLLDSDVDISDVELDARNGGEGNYSGASLTIAGRGEANNEGVLSFSDGNGISLNSNLLMKNSQSIAFFDLTSSPDELSISFTDVNGEIPTSRDVDNILRQITYANSNLNSNTNLEFDWKFNDGNAGSQGIGGSLQVVGTTSVNLIQEVIPNENDFTDQSNTNDDNQSSPEELIVDVANPEKKQQQPSSTKYENELVAAQVDESFFDFESLNELISEQEVSKVEYSKTQAISISVSDSDIVSSLEVNSLDLLPLLDSINSEEFDFEIAKMRSEIEDSLDESSRVSELTVQAAAGVGISLTAGFVSWALRSGSLLASMLSVMPFWRNFDPFPILSNSDKVDNSTASTLSEFKNTKAEKLFD